MTDVTFARKNGQLNRANALTNGVNEHASHLCRYRHPDSRNRAPLRLLTDPVFDPAGSHGRVGVIPGTRYASLVGASIGPQEVGALDAVLLSHDHHQDNLDEAGRALLAKAGKVLTTHTGANRLGGNTVGLRPWEVAEITGRNTTRIRVTATPCRHGPPFSKPIVGHVIGFLLEWKGQQDGAVYLSGDTVWFRGIQQLAVIK